MVFMDNLWKKDACPSAAGGFYHIFRRVVNGKKPVPTVLAAGDASDDPS
jgi:hypothetical protein